MQNLLTRSGLKQWALFVLMSMYQDDQSQSADASEACTHQLLPAPRRPNPLQPHPPLVPLRTSLVPGTPLLPATSLVRSLDIENECDDRRSEFQTHLVYSHLMYFGCSQPLLLLLMNCLLMTGVSSCCLPKKPFDFLRWAWKWEEMREGKTKLNVHALFYMTAL